MQSILQCLLLLLLNVLDTLSTAAATIRYTPPHQCFHNFVNCLAASNADISYPSNATWWHDSQGIHVPVLRRPIAVGYAKTEAEVVALVHCATKFQVKICPRTGGHSYEAFSSEDGQLVVDISRMNKIKVHPLLQIAEVEAGVRLGVLYHELAKHNLTFPAGSCPTVGLAGQISAGGFGFLMRTWGLAADNVIEMEMVDWRGKTLRVNTRENPDLFFALRGGGGGSYGIAIRMILKVHPNPNLSTAFYVTWREQISAAEFGKVWFSWKPWDTLPPEMTLQALLSTQPAVYGMYLGNDGIDGVLRILENGGVLAIGRNQLHIVHHTSKNLMETRAWMINNNTHYENEWDYQVFNVAPTSFNVLDIPPFPQPVHPTWIPIQNDTRVNITRPKDKWSTGPLHPYLPTAFASRDYYKYTSQMFVKELDATAYDALDEFFRHGGRTQWMPFGGIMSFIPDDYNAFPHRKTYFEAQHHSPYHHPGTHEPSGIEGQNFVYRKLVKLLEPYTSHRSYQGYCDLLWTTNPKVYMPRYYGNNVARLIRTKRRYDPHDIFSNEQSTPLHL